MASTAGERLRDAVKRGDVAGIAAALLAGAHPNAGEGTYDWTPLQLAAASGHVAAIAALLAAGAHVDGMFCDWTPLMVAAYNNHTAAVDALVAAGADIHRDIHDGNTALHCASKWGHLRTARLLLEAGARTDLRNEEGNRPIDVVRVLCRLSRMRQHVTSLRHRAQVCTFSDKPKMPALRALFASAEPWSRRRPVTVACYGVEWEWGA
jgi:hypothetical protein